MEPVTWDQLRRSACSALLAAALVVTLASMAVSTSCSDGGFLALLVGSLSANLLRGIAASLSSRC